MNPGTEVVEQNMRSRKWTVVYPSEKKPDLSVRWPSVEKLKLKEHNLISIVSLYGLTWWELKLEFIHRIKLSTLRSVWPYHELKPTDDTCDKTSNSQKHRQFMLSIDRGLESAVSEKLKQGHASLIALKKDSENSLSGFCCYIYLECVGQYRTGTLQEIFSHIFPPVNIEPTKKMSQEAQSEAGFERVFPSCSESQAVIEAEGVANSPREAETNRNLGVVSTKKRKVSDIRIPAENIVLKRSDCEGKVASLLGIQPQTSPSLHDVKWERWLLDKTQADSLSLNHMIDGGVINMVDDSTGNEYIYNIQKSWLTGSRVNCNFYCEMAAELGSVRTKFIEPSTKAICIGEGRQVEVEHNSTLSSWTPKDRGECVFLQADMGTGKTSIVLMDLVSHHVKLNRSVVMVTESRSLAARLKQVFPQFVHYFLDRPFHSEESFWQSNLLIVQYESLRYLSRKKYDVLIIDEVTSFMSHTTSSTMNKPFKESFPMFISLVQSAPFMYGLDADIDPEAIAFFGRLRCADKATHPNDQQTQVIVCTHQPIKGRKLMLVREKKTLITHLDHVLASGKRCVLSVQRKDLAQAQFNRLSACVEFQRKSVLLLTSKGASLFKKGEVCYRDSEEERARCLASPDTHFCVDLLIYTPVVGTGISFERVGHFDLLFAIPSRRSSNARAFQQSLCRVRNLTDDLIIMCTDTASICDPQYAITDAKVSKQCGTRFGLVDRVTSVEGWAGKVMFPNQGCLASWFSSFNPDVVHTIQKAVKETLESADGFLVVLIALLCKRRGMVLSYFEAVKDSQPTVTSSETNIRANEVNKTSEDSQEIVKAIFSAPDITDEEFTYFLKQYQKGSLSSSDHGTFKRYLLRTELGLTIQRARKEMTTGFIETYYHAGPVIKMQRTLMKKLSSSDGEGFSSMITALGRSATTSRAQKILKKRHNQLMESSERISLEQKPLQIQQGKVLLSLLGFAWFGDMKELQTEELEKSIESCILPWYQQSCHSLRQLFGGLNHHPTHPETRRQMLGIINVILHESFGVKVCPLGKGTKTRQQYGLFFAAPLRVNGELKRCKHETILTEQKILDI